MRMISSGVFAVTHDHVNRKTQLYIELRGHVIRRFPWIDGILTLRKAMEQHEPKAQPKYAPVCLSRF